MGEKVGLSSPWMTFYHKLEAFFQKDPGVRLEFIDGEDREIKIYVEGSAKAEALTELLPMEKVFGNVVVKITVIPANVKQSKISLFRAALEGNDALSYIETITPQFSTNSFNYVVFNKEVVQYFNDNLGDINGVNSTLYQDLAKEIFGDEQDLGNVYFCTDID